MTVVCNYPNLGMQDNNHDVADPERALSFESRTTDPKISLSTDTTTHCSSLPSKSNQNKVLDWFSKIRRRGGYRRHISMIAVLIVFMGLATSAAFLSIGITGANSQQADEFTRNAVDTCNRIITAFGDYLQAASLVHNRCRNRDFTRNDFRALYDYILDSDLEFKAVQFIPHVIHAERDYYESEARNFYAEYYPDIEYRGLVGFNNLNATKPEPRTNQSFYFPIHYMEPILGNEAAIDLDMYSSEKRIRAVDALLTFKKPSLTDRLSLVKSPGQPSRCGTYGDPSYGVVLLHPGVNISDSLYSVDEVWPRDISGIVLCIPALLIRSTELQSKSSTVYIHDLSHPAEGDAGVFMGAAKVEKVDNGETAIKVLDEISLHDLKHYGEEARENALFYQQTIEVANRMWTVTVLSDEETYRSDTVPFVIAGGCIILLASIAVAVWILENTRRLDKLNELETMAEAERAALILESAQKAANAERELNDFIAHEVRNPVAAALGACSFVKAALDKENPLPDENSRQLAREDISIVDSSLHFVNDLLRNMLDMHRACANQLKLELRTADLLHDVLEPVGAMLRQRGSSTVKMVIDCHPSDLCIITDTIRLKQVLMNLGRNSSKFIEEGFIRLSAHVNSDGFVVLYVDDSGTGIPEEKRNKLFTKYQESLDLLNQGTGIGLFLCKSLVELMGGEIHLDDSYDSGIPGYPGTRFVINLKTKPLEHISTNIDHGEASHCSDVAHRSHTELEPFSMDLPPYLSVLFVDDDSILRKLFTRCVKLVAPGWSIREAASGEAALMLVENDTALFDIIFIDMYMASVEKQMLGTETVSALREKGVSSIICGLSANSKEVDFLEAGADAYLNKPFPCKPDILRIELCRILRSRKPQS